MPPPSFAASPRRRLLKALAVAPLAGLSACSRPDPERQIRAALGEMEAAIKAKHNSDFMSHVADDFRAPARASTAPACASSSLASCCATPPSCWSSPSTKCA
jgi:hypothetical protein